MAIDANVFAQFAPPVRSVADYSNALAQQDQNALAAQTGRINLLQAQRGMADQDQVRQALATGADLSTPQGRAAFQRSAPIGSIPILKGQADLEHVQAQTAAQRGVAAKDQGAAATSALANYRTALDSATKPEHVAQWMTALYQDPRTKAVAESMGPLDQNLARIPQGGPELQDFIQKNAMGMDKYIADQTQQRGQTLTAATSRANNADNIKKDYGVAGIQASTSRQNNAANIAKDYTIAGISPNGQPVDGGGLLSPESVANAAARYNMDGTLPPNLGRGTQGPRQTAQILNEAARQAATRGDTPEAQRVAQLANKSSAAALNVVARQEGVVGAAEKNFTANANMVSSLAAKVDNTGVPILNKWINAGKRSVAGDPNISALDANIKATVNEYAKIVGGGTGGGATAQGEVAKIEGLLSAAQSPQQIEAVLNVMRQETANRMKSFKDQKAEIQSNMIPTKPAAAPAGKVVHWGDLK